MKQKKTDSLDITKERAITYNGEAEQLIARAIDKNVPVETMEKLLAMRTQLKQERAKEEYNRALSEFQMECPIIGKNKVVKDKFGKDRYKYAPLDEIILQTKELLYKYGFSYTFDARYEDNAQIITCTARHLTGHSESAVFRSPIDKDAYMSEVQKHGSAMTFAKRYAFCEVFGIMTGDEDIDGIVEKSNVTDIKEIFPDAVKIEPKKTKVTQVIKKRLVEISNESSDADKKVLLQLQNKTELSEDELKLVETIKEHNVKRTAEKQEIFNGMRQKLLAKCLENIEGWSVKIQGQLGINDVFPKSEKFEAALSKLTLADYDKVKSLLLLSVD